MQKVRISNKREIFWNILTVESRSRYQSTMDEVKALRLYGREKIQLDTIAPV